MTSLTYTICMHTFLTFTLQALDRSMRNHTYLCIHTLLILTWHAIYIYIYIYHAICTYFSQAIYIYIYIYISHVIYITLYIHIYICIYICICINSGTMRILIFRRSHAIYIYVCMYVYI